MRYARPEPYVHEGDRHVREHQRGLRRGRVAGLLRRGPALGEGRVESPRVKGPAHPLFKGDPGESESEMRPQVLIAAAKAWGENCKCCPAAQAGRKTRARGRIIRT